MNIEAADRINQLPPYLFAKIDEMKQAVLKKGVDVLDFGVGDPDLPTPDFIVEALQKGLKEPGYCQYPSYSGSQWLKETIAKWIQKRFSVALDPSKEVIVLIGSKEGIAHFPLAMINPGDKVLYTSPGYPVYPVATQFAGGVPVEVALKAENNFLPQISELDPSAKMFFFNYPNNPTSAVAPVSFYKDLVAWAKKTNTILCHDAAYSEIYFGDKASPSLLEIKEAKECSIEFHSLSKTFNMTGWRIGFAIGNSKLISALGKVKTNIDSGQFLAVQSAAKVALDEGDAFIKTQQTLFKNRRKKLTDALKTVGLEVFPSDATFYVWTKVPKPYTSMEFTSHLLDKLGIVTTPGDGFGKSGKGYVRFSLTVSDETIEKALERLKTLSL